MEMAGFESTAAEVHGTLCGVLASPEGETADWLAMVLGTGIDVEHLPKPVSEILLGLFQVSRKALDDEDFSFALLIPQGDGHSIVDRTEAVAAWSRGFLLGLSAGGLKEFDSLADAVREALEDLLDIAEVVAEDEEGEQQERALVEIEEYVRVATQLVYDDRRHERDGATEAH